MKIVFLDTSTIGEVDNYEKIKEFGDLTSYDYTPDDKIRERIKDAEIVITNKVVLDKSVLESAKKLKLICVAATGMNNVDLEYARDKKIVVKNAQNYSTDSVAQSTFNALFYLIHQTHYYDQYVKSGAYSQSKIFTHINHNFRELKDKTFGIIGLGNIGQKVAKIAETFGANIIYYSTSGKNTNQVYKLVSLDQLLSKSDIISIHAPLNENTKGLISASEINCMKHNAILINMGRGGIVDEKALSQALEEDKIGGAALDVLETEPIDKNNPLLKIKNKHKLYISPHIGWASLEARNFLIEIICGHLREYKA